jgi:hypothetical protein
MNFLQRVTTIAIYINTRKMNSILCFIAIEEEEDKVDSDFDLDSSEGEQDHIEEGKELDKQIEKAEKKVIINAAKLSMQRLKMNIYIIGP